MRFHLLLATMLLCGTATATDRAMIVLDASGSMWGQIEGKTKIEIARETLHGVMGEVPANLEIGLMAYGHRRKGDCEDIELLVNPAPDQGAQITGTADKLNPKGKTPLTASVEQAAEALKYSEDAATVILITDGLETCDKDPCAAGTELAQTGVDFTAHVVGFGLSEEEGRQVACLAENTGGLYLAADNADQLGEALSHTVASVAAEPEPEPAPEEIPTASLEAPETVEQAARFEVTWDGPGGRYDSVRLFDPSALNGEGKGIRSRSIIHGDMEKRLVTLAAPAKLGTYELRYWDGTSRRTIATRPIEVIEAQTSLTGPESVEIGRTFKVQWQGPGERYDAIHLFDPRARNGEGKVIRKRSLRNDDFENRTATLTAPAIPGDYELRYWNGDNRQVMANTTITVVEADVAIVAPESIEAGRTIKAQWVGPGGKYDSIQIYDPNAMHGEGKVLRKKNVRNDDFENRTVSMPAPAKAGQYQLRYWNGENKTVLMEIPIEVIPVEVGITAADTLEAGQVIHVEWVGPGGRYDAIQLFDPAAANGAGKIVHKKNVRNDDFENRKASLPGPAKAGTYSLRYWNGDNKTVLATRDIEITAPVVSLEAPDQIGQAETITVTWQGPGARYDAVRLFNPTAGSKGKKVREKRLRNDDFGNKRASMPAPAKTGEYELQYWNGDNKAILATRPITVVAVEVALDAPDKVAAGQPLVVNWTGPGARYDEIWIADAAGKKKASKRLRNDRFDERQATVKAPKTPGQYELRYWNGENKAVLFSQSLTVE